MAAVGWLMVAVGGVLVWAGIRDENALTVVTDVFSGDRKLARPAKPLAPGVDGIPSGALGRATVKARS